MKTQVNFLDATLNKSDLHKFDDCVVLVKYKTKDYHQFKKLKANRELNQSHLKDLEEKILKNNKLFWHYIEVNEDMEVMDGQHRLFIAQKLNLDIWYAFVNKDINDVIEENTARRKWRYEEAIRAMSTLLPDVKITSNFIDESKKYFSFHPSLSVLFNKKIGGPKVKEVLEGQLIPNKKQLKDAYRFLDLAKYCYEYMDNSIYTRWFKNTGNTWSLKILIDNNIIDIDIFKNQIKNNYNKIQITGNNEQFLNELVRIYNYNRRQNALNINEVKLFFDKKIT